MAPNVSRTEIDSLLMSQPASTHASDGSLNSASATRQHRGLPPGLEAIDRWTRACVQQMKSEIDALTPGRSVTSAILAASIDEHIHCPLIAPDAIPYLFETGRHAGSLLVRVPQHTIDTLTVFFLDDSTSPEPTEAFAITDLSAFFCYRLMDRLKARLPGFRGGSLPAWTLIAPGSDCDLNSVYGEPGECVSTQIQITIDESSLDFFLTIPPQTISRLLAEGFQRPEVPDEPHAGPRKAAATNHGELAATQTPEKPAQELRLRNLSVEVGRVRLSRREFEQLAVGDILMTEIAPGDRFRLSRGDDTTGSATPCEQDGLRAVRIVD